MKPPTPGPTFTEAEILAEEVAYLPRLRAHLDTLPPGRQWARDVQRIITRIERDASLSPREARESTVPYSNL